MCPISLFDVSYFIVLCVLFHCLMCPIRCLMCPVFYFHVCFKVVDVLNASLASWADATNGPVQFVMKGQNILTEMYVNK